MRRLVIDYARRKRARRRGGAAPVDLHCFCGFSLGEIAELRGVSERTAQREWPKARLVLHQLLGEEEPPAA